MLFCKQHLEWLNRTIFAWHCLPQVWQMKLECGMEVWHCLLCCLISNRCFCLFPAFITPPWTAWHQLLWSPASCFQLLELTPVHFRSLLQTSLKCSIEQPTRQCSMASSPYMMSLIIWPSVTWCIWHSHRKWHWQRRR